MAVETDSKNSHEDTQDLVDGLQSSDRCRGHLPDQFGGSLLQPISLRQSDSRKCNNKEGHQPVVGERAAKEIDDAFLSAIRKERQTLGESGDERRDNNDGRRPQSQRQTDDDDCNTAQFHPVGNSQALPPRI